MDDIMKMVGFFTVGMIVAILLWRAFEMLTTIGSTILSTPIGILAVFILAVMILKKIL